MNPNVVNDDDETPLHLALANGKEEMATWLIREAGANPRIQTDIPPLISAFDGRLLPRVMIDLGLDPSQRRIGLRSGLAGETIAHYAISKPSVHDDEYRSRFLKELFVCDPSLVEAKDCLGRTPLHTAVVCDMDNVVTQLVKDNGASLSATERSGRIPLIEAVLREGRTTITCLLNLMKERDVCVDKPDNKGWTALHYEIFHKGGHGGSDVRVLLESGANANKRNSHGRTPLHMIGFPRSTGNSFLAGDMDISRILNAKNFPSWKAQQEIGSLEGLECLVNSGADATLRDRDRNLPFFLAAATSRVSETFLMIRVAAMQGIFGRGDDIKHKAIDRQRGAVSKRSKGQTPSDE